MRYLAVCCSITALFITAAATASPLTDTLVIPFGHKQSAIVHKYTLDVLDSVVRILNSNKEITLSIEGYAYVDEGDDTICKYLSLDRALFVRDAMLGRGIDSDRITSLKAMAQWKPEKKGRYKINNDVHCRVELLVIYPPPPKLPVISDIDGDGLPDEQDACPDKFGYPEDKGCPLKDVVFVFFEKDQFYLSAAGFSAADNVLRLLKDHPSYTISIRGHASNAESAAAKQVAADRADIVFRYLLSRNIPSSKIENVIAYGNTKPVNAQRSSAAVNENSCAEIIINKHE